MMNRKNDNTARTVLGIVTGGVAFALLFVMWVYPEIPTASYALAALLAVMLGALAWLNQKALREAARTRSVRHGANVALTSGLVVAILVVVSYLNYNHFYRKDLTRNQSRSLSDQTIKIVKELKQDVKLTVFAKTVERDVQRPLVDSYVYQNKGGAHKIAVEWVDPDREPIKAKQANVKKYNTIVVQSGKREARVEDANEEKLTNAFLKVLKENAVTVCFLVGHGERDMKGSDPEGYSKVVADLQSQNYESKPLNLNEEGKVPDSCTAVLILGPSKSFFEKEVAAIRDYLDHGGRALLAFDPNLKTDEPLGQELKGILKDWYIEVPNNLVLDPASKMANMSASVPLIGIFSKESPITRDLTAANISFVPFTSTVEIMKGVPTTINAFWLARSTPYAFAKTNFVKELLTGKVTKDPNKDAQGPNTVMVAISGARAADKAKPDHPTRIVILGSSQIGMNRWVGYGGNSDLLLNAISWLAGDESLISIRPKDQGDQKAVLSEVELAYSKFLTRFLVPGGVAMLGLFVWRRRRRL